MEILLKLAFKLTADSSWFPGWLLEGIPGCGLTAAWSSGEECPPVIGWFLCDLMTLCKSFSDFFAWLQVSKSFFSQKFDGVFEFLDDPITWCYGCERKWVRDQTKTKEPKFEWEQASREQSFVSSLKQADFVPSHGDWSNQIVPAGLWPRPVLVLFGHKLT